MTPQKIMATELVNRFYNLERCEQHFIMDDEGLICKHLAKQCALIVVGMCYKEACKQDNDISCIQRTFWADVTAEIHNV